MQKWRWGGGGDLGLYKFLIDNFRKYVSFSLAKMCPSKANFNTFNVFETIKTLHRIPFAQKSYFTDNVSKHNYKNMLLTNIFRFCLNFIYISHMSALAKTEGLWEIRSDPSEFKKIELISGPMWLRDNWWDG